MGVLEKFEVEMIGASAAAVDMAEDRKLFREAMTRIGLATPRSHQIKITRIIEQLNPLGVQQRQEIAVQVGLRPRRLLERNPMLGKPSRRPRIQFSIM